jgi:FG-GAP repeat
MAAKPSSLVHSLQSAFRKFRNSGRIKSRRDWIAPRGRPGIEVLEDRVTPATFIVNSTLDLPVNLTDGVVTLRDAIIAANTNLPVSPGGPTGDPDGDTIVFDSTVFGGAGATITLTQGDLPIADDLVIDGVTGSGTGATIVTVNGNGVTRIFSIDNVLPAGSSNAVQLTGFTVVNGNGTGALPANDGRGGAIFINIGENVTLTNMTVMNNTANNGGASDPTLGGGGVYSLTSTLTINGGTFTGNAATGPGASGGAVFQNGGTLTVNGGTFGSSLTANVNTAARAGGAFEIRSVESNTTTTISNAVVLGDGTSTNAGVNGGGLHVTTDETTVGPVTATVTVTGGRFNGNVAGNEGGGLWNDFDGNMTITGTNISGNTANGTASDSGGGGVFVQGGTLTINNATIVGNMVPNATGSGGGVLNDGGTLVINGGTISNNSTARAGGGIESTAANRNFTSTISSVTITGNTANINGGGIHVTDPDGGAGTGTFTITGGTIAGNTAVQEGGGVWNDAGSTMSVTGTLITGNTANANNAAGDQQGGGGAFNNGGTLIISGATITGNAVVPLTGVTLGADDGGGGVMNTTTASTSGTVTITNTTISNNSATNGTGSGGGILNVAPHTGQTATVNVTGGTISNNTVNRAGGGVETNSLAGGGSTVINLTGVTVTSNSAGINGGGLHVTQPAASTATTTVTVTNSTFSSNSAGNEGGGLWDDVNAGATINVSGSTFNNNTAVFGGGLFNKGTAGTINVTNSTVSTNSAGQKGGGIDTEGAPVNLLFVTVFNNTATTGGGVNADTSSITANNSVIAGNTATTGANVNGTLTGSFNFTSGDPMLSALTNNGGPTLTHAPLAGSPLLNAGDPSFTPPPSVDQTGGPRVLAGRVDIGAVEGVAALTAPALAVGADVGAAGQVNVFNTVTHTVIGAFFAFGGFTGGIRVATADVNGDGVADIIVGTGAGAPNGHVKVVDGTLINQVDSTGAIQDSALLFSQLVFPGFTGGVFVAGGDIDGDGFAEIIVGSDAGATPHIKVFSGATSQLIASFFAYSGGFTGGVRVGYGDVNGDGFGDIITGAGAGGQGHVKVISGGSLTQVGADGQILDSALLASFLAFQGFNGGVFVAGGDVNGDGFADIIVGAGNGGPTNVKAFNGGASGSSTLGSLFFSIITADVQAGQGVRVGTVDGNGDGRLDILTGTGSAAQGATARLFDGLSQMQLDSFFAFNPPFSGNIFVGGS